MACFFLICSHNKIVVRIASLMTVISRHFFIIRRHCFVQRSCVVLHYPGSLSYRAMRSLRPTEDPFARPLIAFDWQLIALC